MSVLNEVKAIADVKSIHQLTMLPTITTCADAQDEANCINQINQAIIGMKEGATIVITNKVSPNITDAVLRTADGTDFWSISIYKLHKVITATIRGPAVPTWTTGMIIL